MSVNSRVNRSADRDGNDSRFKPQRHYVIELMEKALCGCFSYLVGLFAMEMHLASSFGNSEVNLNSKISY